MAVTATNITSEERTSFAYVNTVLIEYLGGRSSYASYLDAWGWWGDFCVQAGHVRPSVPSKRLNRDRGVDR